MPHGGGGAARTPQTITRENAPPADALLLLGMRRSHKPVHSVKKVKTIASTRDGASFTTASDFLKKLPAADDETTSAQPPATLISPARLSQPTQPTQSAALTQFFTLTCVGFKHHDIKAAEALEEGVRVYLQRDPDNAVDDRAIRVMCSTSAAAGGEADEDEPNAPAPAVSDHDDDDNPSATMPAEVAESSAPPTSSVCVGMLEWREAHDLTPVIDSGCVAIDDVRVMGRRGTHELILRAALRASGDAADALANSDTLNGRKVIGVGYFSLQIGARDAEDATKHTHHVKWPPPVSRPWEPAPAWGVGTRRGGSATSHLCHSTPPLTPPLTPSFEPASLEATCERPTFPDGFAIGWEPPSLDAVGQLTLEEVASVQAAGWPPPDECLLRLGLGGSHDDSWWRTFSMKPPIDWSVSGALDMLPTCPQRYARRALELRSARAFSRRPALSRTRACRSNSSNKSKASALLDGGIHACLPWLPELLTAVDEAMHTQGFWIRRKGDAYIRGFGGPCVPSTLPLAPPFSCGMTIRGLLVPPRSLGATWQVHPWAGRGEAQAHQGRSAHSAHVDDCARPLARLHGHPPRPPARYPRCTVLQLAS